MTAASNNSAPLGDWEDRGLPALRAIFAEGVTAEFANSKYPGEATWYGNQTRGLDIESPNGRADAKSVRIENGEVVLARRNAQPFDPGKGRPDCVGASGGEQRGHDRPRKPLGITECHGGHP